MNRNVQFQDTPEFSRGVEDFIAGKQGCRYDVSHAPGSQYHKWYTGWYEAAYQRCVMEGRADNTVSCPS